MQLLSPALLSCYAERINARQPHKSVHPCFLGHERNLLANEGLVRGRLETTEIVVLNFWT